MRTTPLTHNPTELVRCLRRATLPAHHPAVLLAYLRWSLGGRGQTRLSGEESSSTTSSDFLVRQCNNNVVATRSRRCGCFRTPLHHFHSFLEYSSGHRLSFHLLSSRFLRAFLSVYTVEFQRHISLHPDQAFWPLLTLTLSSPLHATLTG